MTIISHRVMAASTGVSCSPNFRESNFRVHLFWSWPDIMESKQFSPMPAAPAVICVISRAVLRSPSHPRLASRVNDKTKPTFRSVERRVIDPPIRNAPGHIEQTTAIIRQEVGGRAGNFVRKYCEGRLWMVCHET